MGVWGGKKVAQVVASLETFSAFSWLHYVYVNLGLFWSSKRLFVQLSECVPVSKVDNDSRVSSSQDSSHCMLAMILDPSFINKMLGCRLQDPDIVCEHILNLDPWVHSRCQLQKTEGARVQKGRSSYLLQWMSSHWWYSKKWPLRLEGTYEIILANPFILHLWKGYGDLSKVHNVRS